MNTETSYMPIGSTLTLRVPLRELPREAIVDLVQHWLDSDEVLRDEIRDYLIGGIQ